MWVELLINGEQINIQCQQNETIEKVYSKCFSKFYQKPNLNAVNFLYDGKTADPSKTLMQVMNSSDKSRNRLSIIVNKIDDGFVKHYNVICPLCLESASVECKDYKYNLKCDNGHVFNNLTPFEFKKTQEIETSRIVCDICHEKNLADWDAVNFSRCLECKLNICSEECKENHLNNLCQKKRAKHSIVNYNLEENYECIEHKKLFKYVCEKCKKDLCVDCIEKHRCSKNKGRKNSRKEVIGKFKEYEEYNSEINELIEKNVELTKVQKELSEKINSIINYLNDAKRYLNSFIETNTEMLETFRKSKFINYKMIQNMKSINIEETINDINLINKNDNIINQFHDIMNLTQRMKYADELTFVYKVKSEYNNVKIFNEEFVKNNKDNCSIIIDGKNQELSEHININEKMRKKGYLEIKLKGNKTITNMSHMFCRGIKEDDRMLLWQIPDISKWNTTNVTDMSYLFCCCENLESLPDISSWNTSNVKDMSNMISYCRNLESLPDISKWDTSNVTDMSHMFANDLKLKLFPDISKWNTSKVKDMEHMFTRCQSLEKIPDISKWDVRNVMNMSYMFSYCRNDDIFPDISKWNVSKYINLRGMFYCCNLSDGIPDISKWTINDKSQLFYIFYYSYHIFDYFADTAEKISTKFNIGEKYLDIWNIKGVYNK